MLWKIRTELADRPGALAELAARFGTAGINILSLEVFTAQDGAVDELVVSTRAGWTADQLKTLAGGVGTTVRGVQADVLTDGPTRYLRAVARLLDDPCSVDDELERLQGFEAYTPAEWARADVLVEIAARLAARDEAPEPASTRGSGAPVLMTGTAADAKAVVEMHDRCSNRSRELRYHAPIARLTARTARHLIEPAGGASVLAWSGDAVVGMATVAPWDDPVDGAGRPMEAAVLVEDDCNAADSVRRCCGGCFGRRPSSAPTGCSAWSSRATTRCCVPSPPCRCRPGWCRTVATCACRSQYRGRLTPGWPMV